MRSRLTFPVLIACVMAALLGLRIWDPRPLARLRMLAFDTFQNIQPRQYDPNLPVRIIDVDEESLAKIGHWPWPRSTLAELTTKLSELGAVTIGYDIVFAEAERMPASELLSRWPSSTTLGDISRSIGEGSFGDKAFAESLAKVPSVLGFIGLPQAAQLEIRKPVAIERVGDDPVQFLTNFSGAAASLPALQHSATSNAAINWFPEHDQIVRRTPLVIAIGDAIYPSLAAEAVRLGQQSDKFAVISSNAPGERSFGTKTGIARVSIGNIHAPTDANGQIWLHFTRSDKRRFIPAWKLLAGQVPKTEIDGRIILVGTSAAGLFDLRTTPLDASVSGVEIHAQAIEQLASGDYLQRPDFALGAELILITALGALMAVFAFSSGALWSAVFGATSIAAILGGAWMAYTKLGWLVDPVYPVLSLTGLYLFANGYLHVKAEGERNQVRSAFSRYLAPTLVEELAQDPTKLKLGGQLRTVTVMFCDIRNFTGLAEGQSAEDVTRLLNRILTPLSNAILEHRGTIDKYTGDGIMAFWNAPLDDPDHARNAARAALAMQDAIAALNRETSRDNPTGQKAIAIGIGLNTSDCCVGNLGTEQRFDYSVIGDGVNIAARLEALTKTLGLPILTGEQTARAANGLAFLEADTAKLKGKQAREQVYALLGDGAFAASDKFKAIEATHKRVLKAHKAGTLKQGSNELSLANAADGERLTKLYEYYLTMQAR